MRTKLTDMVAVYVPGKRISWEAEVAEGMDLSLVCLKNILCLPMASCTNSLIHRQRPLRLFLLRICTIPVIHRRTRPILENRRMPTQQMLFIQRRLNDLCKCI